MLTDTPRDSPPHAASCIQKRERGGGRTKRGGGGERKRMGEWVSDKKTERGRERERERMDE